MVVYQNISDDLVRAYSDTYHRIQKVGTIEVYDEAIDPVAAKREYEETDEYLDTHVPPREGVNAYSKYRILTKLSDMGKWADIKAWLESSGYIDFWNAAAVFQDDDEKFNAGVEYVKANFGLTDSQVDEILTYARQSYAYAV